MQKLVIQQRMGIYFPRNKILKVLAGKFPEVKDYGHGVDSTIVQTLEQHQ